MTLRVVPADGRFVEPLALGLRESDLNEIMAVDHGETPRQIIARSIHESETDMRWACLNGDRLVAVFGCAPYVEPGIGVGWMLATDEWASAPKRELWSLSKLYVGRMLLRFDVLFNWVDNRNVVSRRWLSRLGFTPGPSIMIGDPPHRFTCYSHNGNDYV